MYVLCVCMHVCMYTDNHDHIFSCCGCVRTVSTTGMSPAMAKLAAQNDLFLDEQHKMEDFDMINKPKHHHGGGGSKPNSARHKHKK